jgi:hypothetical protein
LFGYGTTPDQNPDGLPPALKRVDDQAKRRGVTLSAKDVNRPAMENAMKGGNAWFARNPSDNVRWWTHYYMYGFERYKSFQELVEGSQVKEPDWYNKGVEFLKKTQQADGSWVSPDAPTSNAAIDTAFAVLFLTRSSQKTIKKLVLEEGSLLGGKGLPKDLTDIRVKDGQVVSPQTVQDVEGMLELLEGVEQEELDPTAWAENLTLSNDPATRSQQLTHLSRLVNHENYQVRLSAVKSLSAARDLNSVPALIHALSDPDWRVSKAAVDGLRFVSRRLSGPGLPSAPNPTQVREVQDYWKKWYLSVQPNGQLMD